MATSSTSTPRRFSPQKMSLPSFHIPNVGLKRPSFSIPRKRPSISTPSSVKRLGSSMGSRMSKMMSWRYRVKNKNSSVTEKVPEDEGDDNALDGVDELPPAARKADFYKKNSSVRVTSRHQRSSTGAELSLTSMDSEDSEEEEEAGAEMEDLLDEEEKRRLSMAERRRKERYAQFMSSYNPTSRQQESRELGMSETQTLDNLEKRSLPRATSSVLDDAEKRRLDRAGQWSRAHSTAAKSPVRRTRSSMSTAQGPLATTSLSKPNRYLGGRDKSTSAASTREMPRHVQTPVRPTVTVAPKVKAKPKARAKTQNRTTGSQTVRVVTASKPRVGANGRQSHRQVVRIGKQESTKRRPSWLAAVRQGKAEKPNVREKILQREQSQVAAMESMRQRRIAAQELLKKKREAAQRRVQRSKAQTSKKAAEQRTTAQSAPKTTVTSTRQAMKPAATPQKTQAQAQAQEPGILEMLQQRVYEFWDPQSAGGQDAAKAEPKKVEPKKTPSVVAAKPRTITPQPRPTVAKAKKVVAPRVQPRSPSPVVTKPMVKPIAKQSFAPFVTKPTPKPQPEPEPLRSATKVEWKPPVFASTKQEEEEDEEEDEAEKDERIVSWRDEQKNDLKTSSMGKEGMAAFKAMLEQNYSSQIMFGSVAGTAPTRTSEPKPLHPTKAKKPREGTPFLDMLIGGGSNATGQSADQAKKPKAFKVKKVTLKKLKAGAPELAKYQKMRDYGLPDGAIVNKMTRDGFDASCIDLLETADGGEAEAPQVQQQQQQQQQQPVVMTVIPARKPAASPVRRPVTRARANRKTKPKSGIKGTIKNMRPKKKTARGSRNYDADVGGRKAVFENLAQAHKDKMARNPFSGSHNPRAIGIKRGDEGYGQGNQAVYERGKQVMQEGVEQMMVELRSIAKRDSNGVLGTTFGELFKHYENLSTNLVKYLLNARKQKLVDFDGEYLRQTRDDHVVIRVL